MQCIGIDLGGTKIEGVLLAPDGAVRARLRVPSPAAEGYEAVLGALVDLIVRLQAEACDPATVGLGIPGCLDAPGGLVKNANSTCLIGRPLQRDLEARLGCGVRVANDANCFAVAEAHAGAARGAEVVFGVILGTGVGGGVVIGGRARAGLHGIAGEWGHSPIHDADPMGPPPPPCYCGQRGCVETRLSGPALERDYVRLGGEPAPAACIVERAEQGDAAAERALARYLGFLGEGLARVIHVLDPDVIVLGGGMSNAAVLYERAPAAVEQALFDTRLRTPILRNALGDSAGVFGAAWLWLDTPPQADGTTPPR